MNSGKYSEKEIEIFNGVIKLISNGVSIHDMKASDIAKMSNIGKGTLYNYFDSKEEIIVRAIIYMVESEFGTIEQKVHRVKGFKKKFYTVLNAIEDFVKMRNTTITWFISNIKDSTFKEQINDVKDNIKQISDELNSGIDNLVQAGIKDGTLAIQNDKEYYYRVFLSALFGYSHIFCPTPYDFDYKGKVDKAKDDAYSIVIKSLG